MLSYKDYLTGINPDTGQPWKRQYQEHATSLLLEKKHACLFFEPGKGKTYPAIEAILEINKMKNDKANVLIISSADAIKEMWQPDIVSQNILPENTYLVTSRMAIGEMGPMLLSMQWDIILLDESHIVKAHNSQIHKLIFKLCKNVEYAWGLTGTPRGNTDLDIWCQLQALSIGGQGKWSYSAFTNMACVMETQWGPFGAFRKPNGWKSQYEPIWDKLLDEYCMFVDYDETDDMPDLEVKEVEIPYEKTPDYERALKGIIEVGDYASTTTKLVAISKAYQACNGYLYLPDETIHRIHVNKKTQWLLDNITNEPMVIVYKHRADLEDLLKLFGTKATTTISEFKQRKYNVLLLQCGKAQSFNLQGVCRRIIFYTLDYSFIKYKQMIHRCWRLGQELPVEIIILQHKDTIEKAVWLAVSQKQKAHDLFMSIKRSD